MHGYKFGCHKDRSVHVAIAVIEPPESNSLSHCLVPRHSLIHSKLSKILTFFLATFVYEQWLQQFTADMSVDFSTGQRCIHQHGLHCCSHQNVHLSASNGSAMPSCSASTRSLLCFLLRHPCQRRPCPQTLWIRPLAWKHPMPEHRCLYRALPARLRDLVSRAPAPPALPPVHIQQSFVALLC